MAERIDENAKVRGRALSALIGKILKSRKILEDLLKD